MAKRIDSDFLKKIQYCPNSPSGLIWIKPDSRRVKPGDTVGFVLSNRYWAVSIKRSTTYLIHRVIWTLINGPIPDGKDIDHKDTNKLNNKIDNLRLATKTQNNHNTPKSIRNKSGYKGISWCKQTGMWRASIMCDGKSQSKRSNDLDVLNQWLDSKRIQLHQAYANKG